MSKAIVGVIWRQVQKRKTGNSDNFVLSIFDVGDIKAVTDP